MVNETGAAQQARELADKVAAIPFWFHSIDLGMG
jgi:hypothetical protein